MDMDIDAVEIEPRRVDWTKHRGKRSFWLAACEVRESSIPGGGLGLFAAQDIVEGDAITLYGGAVLSHSEGRRLVESDNDTHLCTVSVHFDCLDGRVTDQMTLGGYYAPNHLVGSFVNSIGPDDDKSKRNARFESAYPGFQHPNGGIASATVLIVATRNVRAGDEIFVDYSRSPQGRFFT